MWPLLQIRLQTTLKIWALQMVLLFSPFLSEAVFSISCSCAFGWLFLSSNASSSASAVATWNKVVKPAVFGDVPQSHFFLLAQWLIIDLWRRNVARNTWTVWSSVNCIMSCLISSIQHASSSFPRWRHSPSHQLWLAWALRVCTTRKSTTQSGKFTYTLILKQT